jgi:hypothetical protein
MVLSRAKGCRGEREWATYVKETYGIEARRGQQFSGGADSPDVVTHLPIHFEVKRVNTLNVQKALDQAIKDSKDEKVPLVASRKDRGEWILHFRAKDLKRIIDAFKDEIKVSA